MEFTCPVCGKYCCECQGCLGVFVTNAWVCPNCVTVYQNRILTGNRLNSYRNINNNQNWQQISQHLRKK